jgi:hypothetical protein
MELDEAADVDIGNTVTPSQHECRVVQERLEPLDPTSGIRPPTSVDQLDPPLLVVTIPVAVMGGNVTGSEVDSETLVRREVVGKEALDVLAFVPERDNEVVESEVGVVAHDVPKHRPPTDLHHRLRSNLCFFR